MKAMVVRTFGDESALEYLDWDRPSPNPGELLVRVGAAAVNPVDTLMRAGNHPRAQEVPMILGIDVAGEVIEVGAEVEDFASGNRVFGFVGGGGYAEYACLPAEGCALIPDGVDFATAAASTSSAMTALHALRDIGRVAPSDTLWIRGGAGGVGTAAIQIGRALGANILADCGSDHHIPVLEELGADRAFNRRTTDPIEVARDFGDNGVDCILDLVGTDNVVTDCDALRVGGRVLIVGLGTGKERPTTDINLRAGLGASATLHFVYLFAAADRFGALLEQIADWLGDGTIKPIIADTLPLERAPDAHRRLIKGGLLGKLVLTP